MCVCFELVQGGSSGLRLPLVDFDLDVLLDNCKSGRIFTAAGKNGNSQIKYNRFKSPHAPCTSCLHPPLLALHRREACLAIDTAEFSPSGAVSLNWVKQTPLKV